jgi:hypothetical protein
MVEDQEDRAILQQWRAKRATGEGETIASCARSSRSRDRPTAGPSTPRRPGQIWDPARNCAASV